MRGGGGVESLKDAPNLRGCLKIRIQRRVRARGLQDTPKIPILCGSGLPTGRIFRRTPGSGRGGKEGGSNRKGRNGRKGRQSRPIKPNQTGSNQIKPGEGVSKGAVFLDKQTARITQVVDFQYYTGHFHLLF